MERIFLPIIFIICLILWTFMPAFSDSDVQLDGLVNITNNVIVGTPAGTETYNAFGGASPSSDDIANDGDLFTLNDIEVGGSLYLSRNLYMEGTNSTWVGGDQTIYFYEDDSRTGEYIRWDDSDDAFRITHDIYLGRESDDAVRVIFNNNDISFSKDQDNDSPSSWYRFYTDGASFEQMRILEGNEAPALFDGTVVSNGIDYAEAYKITDTTLEAGDVVTVRLDWKEYIERSAGPYDLHIVGVISERPGFVTGDSFDAEEQADPSIASLREKAREAGDREAEKRYTLQLMEKKAQQSRPVALSGRVPVKVDAASGPIKAGDHLTSGPTPGYAMAMDRPGKTFGIALEDWDGVDQGKILALIQPGWYGGYKEGQEPLTADKDGREPDSRVSITPGSSDVQLVLDQLEGEVSSFCIAQAGKTGPDEALLRLDDSKGLHVNGSIRSPSSGLAEYHPVLEDVEAGDLMVADAQTSGWMRRSNTQDDPAVIGIVAEDPGLVMAEDLSRLTEISPDLVASFKAAQADGDQDIAKALWQQMEALFSDTFVPIALAGTVRCKVDAAYGTIRVGDLLTTSATQGHAMRTQDPLPGTVVGKALEPLAQGAGVIRIMVMLR